MLKKTSSIKRFHSESDLNECLWKRSDEKATIIPGGVNINVIIPNNLTVRGNLTNPSDINLKKDIIEITSDKATQMKQLRCIEYKYKDDKSDQTHFGFIAQEMNMVYPNLVQESDIGKTINYLELIPMLVKRMNDLETQLEIIKCRRETNN